MFDEEYIHVCLMRVCMGHSIKLPPKTDNRTHFIIQKKLPCDHTLHSPQKLIKQVIFLPKSALRPGVSMVTQQIFVENEMCPVISVFGGNLME